VPVPKWLCAMTRFWTPWPPLMAIWSSPVLGRVAGEEPAVGRRKLAGVISVRVSRIVRRERIATAVSTLRRVNMVTPHTVKPAPGVSQVPLGGLAEILTWAFGELWERDAVQNEVGRGLDLDEGRVGPAAVGGSQGVR